MPVSEPDTQLQRTKHPLSNAQRGNLLAFLFYGRLPRFGSRAREEDLKRRRHDPSGNFRARPID